MYTTLAVTWKREWGGGGGSLQNSSRGGKPSLSPFKNRGGGGILAGESGDKNV